MILGANQFSQKLNWHPGREPAGTFSLWLDGLDRSTFIVAAGLVSRVADKSGAGNHATQASDALKPSDTGDGFAVAGNRYLDSALSASNNNESIFAVVNATDIAGNRSVLGSNVSGGRQFRSNGTNLQLVRASVAAVTASTTLRVPEAVNAILEEQLQFGAAVVFGVNGVTQAIGSHSTAFATGAGTQIGASMAGQGAVMTVREILVLPGKPTAQMATRIRAYLKKKWNTA